MKKNTLFISLLILVSTITSSMGFSDEFNSEINDSSSGYAVNYVTKLESGIGGDILEIKKINQKQYALKIKITNGVYEGESFWVYYRPNNYKMIVLGRDHADIGEEGLVIGNRVISMDNNNVYMDFHERNLEETVKKVLPMISKGKADVHLNNFQVSDCNKEPKKTEYWTITNGVITRNGAVVANKAIQGNRPYQEQIPVPKVDQPVMALEQPKIVVEQKRAINPAVTSLMANALQFEEEGKFAEAVSTLERALRIDSQNSQIYYELANITAKQGKFAEAEHMALKGIASTMPDNETKKNLWLLISKARYQQENFQGVDDAQAKARAIPSN